MAGFIRPALEFGGELVTLYVGQKVSKQTQNAQPNEGVPLVAGTGRTNPQQSPSQEFVEITPGGRTIRRPPRSSTTTLERISRLRSIVNKKLKTRLGGTKTIVKRTRSQIYRPSRFYRTRKAFSNLRYRNINFNF